MGKKELGLITDKKELLEKLLLSFEAYYNVNRDRPMPPFDAEALFATHSEEFFLIKEAKITEFDSSEYVFFYTAEHLDLEEAKRLERIVWEETLRRADPKTNHRNSDGVLFILADHIDDEAADYIEKLRRFKSYFFGLHGSSTIRLVAMEVSTGEVVSNRHGRNLEKLLRNIH